MIEDLDLFIHLFKHILRNLIHFTKMQALILVSYFLKYDWTDLCSAVFLCMFDTKSRNLSTALTILLSASLELICLNSNNKPLTQLWELGAPQTTIMVCDYFTAKFHPRICFAPQFFKHFLSLSRISWLSILHLDQSAW
jgi:hypothetical protein